MKIDRVVIDTNVLIGASLLDGSVPAQARNHAVGHSRLVATDDTVREFIDRLMLPKFDTYVSRSARDALAQSYLMVVDLVPVTQLIRACRDPRDDKFLEAAVNGRADVIISGDKDLLSLNPFAGIYILSPADYLARVSSGDR
jgi:putative PIN family toxin of toxin-antitoxin system